MKLSILLLELIIFTALVFAENIKKIEYQPIVVPLNKGNFTEIINKAPQVIVKYYSPSCGHCKELAPTYSSVAKYIKERKVRAVVAEVDCSVEKEICAEQKITKYPTLLFYKEGKLEEEFDGKRTKEAISDFIIENSRSKIYIVHKKEVKEFIEKFKTDKDNLIIGYFERIGDTDYKEFEKVSKKLGDKYIFAAAGDKEAADAAGGVVIPGIVMYKTYDEAIPRNTELNEKVIEEFIRLHEIPNIQELTKENYQTYVDTGIPLAIYYYQKESQYKKHYDDLHHIAKLYRDRLYFVASKTMLLDKNRFNKVPFFGVYDPKQPEFFYPFMKGKRMNQANLVQFGEAFFRHEIIPQILEEPIKGRVYENHVVVLDEKNYDEIVLDEERDVVVLYYSDTCRYSQKLKPIYDFIGEKYLYQRQNITIAKFDAFNRKIPKSSPWNELEYYPTIVVYPAIDKEKLVEEAKKENSTIEKFHKGAILYRQDAIRGLKEIAEFINKVTTHQSKILLNIMELSRFDVDDEISSSEEESDSDDEDLDADTALERARKRKEAELRKKEKLAKKEEMKKLKQKEREKKENEKKKEKENKNKKDKKEEKDTKTVPEEMKIKGSKVVPESIKNEKPNTKPAKDIPKSTENSTPVETPNQNKKDEL